MTIREYRLQQLKTLKGKPFREKWDYIMEYFGLQILLVIAVIVAGVFFIVKVASEKDSALSIACINATPNYEQAQDFIQQYAEHAGIDLEEMEVQISTDLICTDEKDMVEENYQSTQRLLAQLTAGELDILASDSDTITAYMYQEVFCDLSQVLTEAQQEAYADKFLYADLTVIEQIQQSSDTIPKIPDATKPEEMEKPVPMALRIPRDSDFADRYFHYYSADIYLGVVLNAQNVENALAFIDYIYGAENG